MESERGETDMKRHLLSIVLCGLYIAATVACWVVVYTSTDQKGAFVFTQLPLIPSMAILGSTGLLKHLEVLSWSSAYLVLFPLTLLLLFVIGWLITWMTATTWRLFTGRRRSVSPLQ